MKLEYISASRLDTYSTCRRKYYYIYELKLEKSTHPAAHLGSAIHKALENYVAKGTDLIQAYNDAYKESPLTSKAYYDDGKAIIESLIKRGIIDEGSTPLATEQPFDLVLDNGVRLKGVIDRVDKIRDDLIEITDYKSTKYPFTQKEIDNNIQVGVYSLVAREHLYPGYPLILITFDFVRYHRMGTFRTDSQLEALKIYLATMKAKIESDENPEGTVGSHCRYCDYRVMCPEYKKKIDEPIPDSIKDFDSMSDEELIQVLYTLGLKISDLEAKEKFLKNYFKGSLMNDERLSMQGNNGHYISLSSRQQKTVYKDEDIKKALKAKGIPFKSAMVFDKKKVDELLSEDAQEELKKSASIYYNEPSVKAKWKEKNEE